MTEYTAGFQHPDYGIPMFAKYEHKRLTVMVDDPEFDDVSAEGQAGALDFVKRFDGKRFETPEAAERALVNAGVPRSEILWS